MLRIGDFSTLSEISIHMLRNYDKIGLLVPAHVDATSGYRYYAESQLADAGRIQALKAMGLGLASIKDILGEYSDSESLAGYLSVQAAVKREELESLQQQIHRLESTAAALRRDANMLQYSIEVKTIPQRTVASIRGTIDEYPQEGKLWQALGEALAAQNIRPASPAYDMTIYLSDGYVENGIAVEMQKSVCAAGENTGEVVFKQAPPILAAALTYEGEYQQVGEVGELIANWVRDNHYAFCGPRFNIYHNSPATEQDSGKMVTEVCFPVKK